METSMIRGHANDHKEKFEFTIEPFVIRDQGFLLMIDYRGDGRSGGTGAGVWPTVEKAKQIAEQTAAKLLHGATITWEQ
jgi:hypothetical protein